MTRRRVATLLLASLLTAHSPANAEETNSQAELRHQLDSFTNVLYLVLNKSAKEPDSRILLRGAIAGMLAALPPGEAWLEEGPEAPLPDDEAGVGVNVESGDGAIRINSAIMGSSAFDLGVQAGDRIVAFDGKPAERGLTATAAVKLLRGPSGSTLALTVERDGEPAPLTFTLVRAKLASRSIPCAFMIRPDVGYVRLAVFSSTAGDDLARTLASLEAKGMRSLLLDLRSNQGGALSQVVDVLDVLVPEARRLVMTRGRIPSANADYYSTGRAGKWAGGPMVVLVDHSTASGGEIVAGAVQDLDRGLVAGRHTLGKGRIQSVMTLPDDTRLRLTVAMVQTPSGRPIQCDDPQVEAVFARSGRTFETSASDDAVLGALPTFRTASGRVILGGGGVQPDMPLPADPGPSRLEQELLRKGVLREFALRLEQARGATSWTAQSLGDDFDLSAGEWAELGRIAASREVSAADSPPPPVRAGVLRKVRMEIAKLALGGGESSRIAVEGDAEVAAALEFMPRAEQLLTRSKAATSRTPAGH